MRKILLGSFIGLILLGGGFVSVYLGMQGVSAGGPPILLIIGLVSFCAGLGVLYKAGRIDAFKSKFAETPAAPGPKGESVLEKHNKIISEWNETNNKRDKLKMLEAAGAAEEGKTLS
jgi:hypothetical protein